MSVTSRFTNWAVELHALTAQNAAAIYVDGVQGIELNPQLVTSLEASDGSEYNTYSALTGGQPRATFRTTDLKALLDECSSFMLVDSDGTHPGVRLFLQAYADGGSRASTGAVRFVFADGLLVLRRLELNHQRTATIGAEVIGKSTDGTTSPVALATAQSLPAGVYPTTGDAWTLGKVDLNGTQFEGIDSVSIDFGLQVAAETRDSDIYPTYVTVQRIAPSITIRGVHVDDLATLSVDGAFYAASTVEIYARKRAEGGKFVADGTAEHVKFTLGKVRVDPGNISGDPKTIDLTLRPYYTPGASPVLPITIDTASIIS